MKLVVGGAHQGKTEYAVKQLGIDSRHILQAGEAKNLEAVLEALHTNKAAVQCVSEFHLLVRYAVEHALDIHALVEQMLSAHPDIVVLMDEVGCGIIPMEKEERIYREQVGRAGCLLARQACQVIRVVCGIGTVIKDTE